MRVGSRSGRGLAAAVIIRTGSGSDRVNLWLSEEPSRYRSRF